MKKLLLLCTLLCALTATAQDSLAVYSVDAETIKNVAKESPKKNTLFYTFGIWCEPCRLHLPTAIKLAKDYDLEFYVLIVDSQTSEKTKQAAAYLREIDKDIKLAVLDDAVYGEKTKKRNKKFVDEITPPQFEAIDDFSKYIVLNQQGEVIMVTTWKDNRDNDWRDDSKMVQQKIVPLLTK